MSKSVSLNEVILAENPPLERVPVYRQGIDELLDMRKYFIDRVQPQLVENLDFYPITIGGKTRKSLAKGGAEKLSSIFRLTAQFTVDLDTMKCLEVPGLVVYICDLTSIETGKFMGQGRGADTLDKNARDPNPANKTVKMAQKRAYIDAVIRATGLSDIFTQDMEDGAENHQSDTVGAAPPHKMARGRPLKAVKPSPQAAPPQLESSRSLREPVAGAGPIEEQVDRCFKYFKSVRVSRSAVLKRLGKVKPEDITFGDLDDLRFVASQIRLGKVKPEDIFDPDEKSKKEKVRDKVNAELSKMERSRELELDKVLQSEEFPQAKDPEFSDREPGGDDS